MCVLTLYLSESLYRRMYLSQHLTSSPCLPFLFFLSAFMQGSWVLHKQRA